MKTNIIFLDIDGVLNSERSIGRLDPIPIKRIANLCKNTNSKVIISSSWRWATWETTYSELNRHLELRPILKYCIGQTPRFKVLKNRGDEIEFVKAYLYDEKNILEGQYYNIELLFELDVQDRYVFGNYLIIDDEKYGLENSIRDLLLVSNYTGFTIANYEEAKKRLLRRS